MLEIIPILLKYKKAILLGLILSAGLLMGLKINQWRNDSHKLDKVLEENVRFNTLNEKSHTIGLELDNGLNQYRKDTRDIKPASNHKLDNGSVQRTRQRLEALGDARRASGM